MAAGIRLDLGGKKVDLLLEPGSGWSTQDPELQGLAQRLNSSHPLRRFAGSPADGSPVANCAKAAARDLGGQAILPKPKPDDGSEVIY